MNDAEARFAWITIASMFVFALVLWAVGLEFAAVSIVSTVLILWGMASVSSAADPYEKPSPTLFAMGIAIGSLGTAVMIIGALLSSASAGEIATYGAVMIGIIVSAVGVDAVIAMLRGE